MAIDSTLFSADIPAGAYSVGDVVNLAAIAGPANVRSGRGSAVLKQITCGCLKDVGVYWEILVKNSDWVDSVGSFAGDITTSTALDYESGGVQNGSNNDLTANSGWQVWAVCKIGGTSSAATSLFAIVDIDYPQVSAITNPDDLIGVPCSIEMSQAVPIHAFGSMGSATWTVQNVDYFKAGAQYCLRAVEMLSASAQCGFIAFANAAGMGGLQRIVPVNNLPTNIRARVRYASRLVKGPMDVKIMMFSSAATSGPIELIHDYVKRTV